MKRLLILLAFLSSAVLLAGCNRVSLDESVMIALDWVIPPELPHEHIRMCSCGRFFLGTADSLQWDEVDPATGKLTDGFHGGHGMGEHPWVHDPALGLFGHGANDGYGSPIGLHPLENFEENVIHAFTFEDGTVAEHMFEWILPRARGLLAVESVDSTKREYHDSGGWITWWLTQDAFSGRFALMYNLDFTTDFIFDEVR
ncbi:MAG: hypothetical protein FWB74_06180, partial [Defluviitaleaceae bacterium]|nr:hypothetical protein [Defluviitaleaceae bacterium]